MEDASIAASAFRKVMWRLIPLIAALYFFHYLDRTNIGFAALTMNGDLAFSATVYGNGAGIFFLGYVLFGIPSSMGFRKFGARRWLALIVVLWGCIAAALAFTHDVMSFYVIRFVLGLAEAGFIPGIIYFLSSWFPASYRAKIIGAFLAGGPVSSIFGAPISTALLGVGGLGLKGWQWLFVLEGVPAILLGLATFFFITDTPHDAKWLSAAEREWLARTVQAEQQAQQAIHRQTLGQALSNPVLFLFGVIYFGVLVGFYGLTLWLPQIIKSFGGTTNLEVGFLTAVPYVAAGIGMYLWSRHSDATGERTWHVAIPALVACVSLAASGYLTGVPWAAFIALIVATVAGYSVLPVFWTLPAAVLSGAAAAGGIALINSIGNLGGYFGPSIIGYVKDATGSFTYGLVAVAACIGLSGIGVLLAAPRLMKAPNTNV